MSKALAKVNYWEEEELGSYGELVSNGKESLIVEGFGPTVFEISRWRATMLASCCKSWLTWSLEKPSLLCCRHCLAPVLPFERATAGSVMNHGSLSIYWERLDDNLPFTDDTLFIWYKDGLGAKDPLESVLAVRELTAALRKFHASRWQAFKPLEQ